jgi:hypothetical protein
MNNNFIERKGEYPCTRKVYKRDKCPKGKYGHYLAGGWVFSTGDGPRVLFQLSYTPHVTLLSFVSSPSGCFLKGALYAAGRINSLAQSEVQDGSSVSPSRDELNVSERIILPEPEPTCPATTVFSSRIEGAHGFTGVVPVNALLKSSTPMRV